jgi:NAD(P)-dependent dehydrogenase (short-subunit alcohol dehydrogenase family)
MSEVTVVIGAGSIGQAIARRVSAGKQVLLADLRQGNAEVAAEVLSNAGFEVSTATVDVSSRESVHALIETATAFGNVTGVIHAAGVSPSQASPAVILAVDLYGTAVVLEEFGKVIARGGAGVVISSQSGHRLGTLTAEQDAALATTPADELLSLSMLGPDQVTDSLHAYQLAKRGNSLRVMAEAVRWGKRGARVNTISPGIIFTPLARDELTGPLAASLTNTNCIESMISIARDTTRNVKWWRRRDHQTLVCCWDAQRGTQRPRAQGLPAVPAFVAALARHLEAVPPACDAARVA